MVEGASEGMVEEGSPTSGITEGAGEGMVEEGYPTCGITEGAGEGMVEEGFPTCCMAPLLGLHVGDTVVQGVGEGVVDGVGKGVGSAVLNFSLTPSVSPSASPPNSLTDESVLGLKVMPSSIPSVSRIGSIGAVKVWYCSYAAIPHRSLSVSVRRHAFL